MPKEGAHSEVWNIVYLDTGTDEYVTIPVLTNRENGEEGVYNHLVWKGTKQVLKNIFKVNHKGQVTKFKDLELENPKLINKIGELTRHGNKTDK